MECRRRGSSLKITGGWRGLGSISSRSRCLLYLLWLCWLWSIQEDLHGDQDRRHVPSGVHGPPRRAERIPVCPPAHHGLSDVSLPSQFTRWQTTTLDHLVEPMVEIAGFPRLSTHKPSAVLGRPELGLGTNSPGHLILSPLICHQLDPQCCLVILLSTVIEIIYKPDCLGVIPSWGSHTAVTEIIQSESYPLLCLCHRNSFLI